MTTESSEATSSSELFQCNVWHKLWNSEVYDSLLIVEAELEVLAGLLARFPRVVALVLVFYRAAHYRWTRRKDRLLENEKTDEKGDEPGIRKDAGRGRGLLPPLTPTSVLAALGITKKIPLDSVLDHEIILQRAIRQCQTDVVRLLLCDKKYQQCAQESTNILPQAVRTKNLPLMRMLLRSIAPSAANPTGPPKLNEVDDDAGITPFLEAVYWGDRPMAELLFKAGSNIHMKSTSGATALHYVCRDYDIQFARWLFHIGFADVDAKWTKNQRTPIAVACYHENLEVVKFLAEEKNADLTVKDEDHADLLHLACYGKNLDLIKYLVEGLRLDVKGRDEKEVTHLHRAIGGGHYEIGRYLISRGANVEATDAEGYSTLHCCCMRLEEDTSMIEYLIKECKMDPNQASTKTMVPLHFAAYHGSNKLIQCLLDNGGDVNAADNDDGFTSLFAAVMLPDTKKADYSDAEYRAKREEMVNLKITTIKLLMENGANANRQSGPSKKSPLMFAIENSNWRAALYLIQEWKCDFQATDSDGNTPLFYLEAVEGPVAGCSEAEKADWVKLSTILGDVE